MRMPSRLRGKHKTFRKKNQQFHSSNSIFFNTLNSLFVWLTNLANFPSQVRIDLFYVLQKEKEKKIKIA